MQFPLIQKTPSSTVNNRRVKIAKAELRSQRKLTHDTYELKIVCSDNSGLAGASSGQFATLLFPDLSGPKPYSFARDPASEKDGQYTFYIRLVPGGEVSTWLSSKDRTGAMVEIAGPLGDFRLDNSQNTMVFVGGGSGMSAIKSLIEEACRLEVRRDCWFFYGARSQLDLYCGDEMTEIRNHWHPDHEFKFIQVLSAEREQSEWSGPRGHVVDYIEDNIGILELTDWASASIFLCGPSPMVEAGKSLFERKGVSESQVHVDIFEDASSPAPTIDNSKCVLCDECLLVKPIENCIVETSSISNLDGGLTSFKKIKPGISSGLYYNSLFIDAEKCIRCQACVSACPHGAIATTKEDRIHRTLRHA